jgi:hypothetical protein
MAGKTKSRRGGFLGSLINQAIVPFGILGMQQSYKRKSRGGTRKRGGKRGSKRGGRHGGTRRR